MSEQRTPARKKARELAKYLRAEHPDYSYLKRVCRCLREELEIEVPRSPKRLPEVPTEEEIRLFYETVWKARKFADMVLIKTLFYTGVRISELVTIRLIDVDLDRCQIRINGGKGDKDRIVPFPFAFRELLGQHMQHMQKNISIYLFESSRRHKYSERGVRKKLASYAKSAGITRSVSPHKWRHFLFTWLKKRGIDDALIQPYSGHESRRSLEIYSRLSLSSAQDIYEQTMRQFPIQ
jgi:integrase/recombinase XerD